jgi:excisionase family DNA binding protein
MKILLTVPEAAAALGLRVPTLRRMIYEGRLKPVHPTGSRAVRMRVDDVMALAEHSPSAHEG